MQQVYVCAQFRKVALSWPELDILAKNSHTQLYMLHRDGQIEKYTLLYGLVK